MARFKTAVGWRTRLRSSPAVTFQPQVEPVLDAPMRAVGLGHLEGGETFSRARSDQPVSLDPVGLGPRTIAGPGLARRLGYGGKADLFGRGRKADQAAGFQPAAIEFNPLNEVRRVPEGEKAPTHLGSSCRTLSATPGWLPLTVKR